MVRKPPSRLITAAGPRAAEQELLGALGALRARSLEDLREPVRVIVPSRSLRLHVAARLAAGGRPVAGVLVETLAGLARGVLARSGAPVHSADAVLGVLTRRFAAEEPELASSLAGFADPFSAVVASVRDLLDAGLGPEQAEAGLELLSTGAARELRAVVVERSRAVVRVAARVATAANELGVDLASRALVRAAEALDRGAVLPARAVVVHGFAETTGAAGELVEAVVRGGGAVVIVDLPPDAAGDDAGAFARRLVDRLSRVTQVERSAVSVTPRHLEVLEAADAEAEAREVAERAWRLIDDGVEPERIGIVARGIETRLTLLARHLDRLGVPFSGVSLAAPGGGLRVRLGGLLAVLAAGTDATVDRWREAVSGLDASFEVAAALRVLGASRLVDLAGLEPPRQGVRLPLGVATEPDDEGDESGVEPLRVPARQLAAQRDGARAAVDLLTRWPETARPAVHAIQTARLLECQGGWPAGPETALHEALEACAAGLAPLGPVSRPEWARALAEVTRELGSTVVGGRGGGVQVLGAMEARARTFDHLFVVGMQRDAFPRRVVEDPLLPDGVRARLAVVLPEVPIKARGHIEERYLFGQLASAAPKVTLSWAANGGQGSSPASPFVEEVRAVVGSATTVSRGVLAGTPTTSWERAVSGGIKGDREAWAAQMAGALDEGWRRTSAVASAGTAAADGLFRILEELERPVRDAGPLLGVIGPGALARTGAATVTRFEAFARCPWQAFVTRILRVQPMADPMLALPAVDRRLVGVVVHDVLARRAVACGAGRDLGLLEARGRVPATLMPADDDWINANVQDAAVEAVRREGVPYPGFAPVLAGLARPFVAAALDLDAGVEVLAVEADGHAEAGGIDLHFRADRVDAAESGSVLTDYKTGRPPWTRLKRISSRRRHLLDRIARGELLQAAAYAAAEPGASGRYLFLEPEVDDGGIEVRVESTDEEATARLNRAVAALRRAWSAGAVVPRTSRVVVHATKEGDPPTLDLRESNWCRSCSVREACLRDDSGLRGRLEAWLDGSGGGGELDAAAVGLWRLGAGVEEGAE